MSAEAVAAIVARSGSAFTLGMRLLPADRRRALHAVYAFCRIVDDIADGPAPAAEKLAGLAAWRAELDGVYAGRPRHPVAVALAEAAAAHHLDRQLFEEVLDGMEADARGRMVAPDLADLQRYCRQVAGAVGLLSTAIFGARDAASRDFALALGDALQITNILCDLEEDAGLGRLYLPREMLEAAGIRAREPAAVLADPALGRVTAAMADWAEARYAEAQAALGAGNRRRLRPALAMMAVYRDRLRRIRRLGAGRRPPVPRLWRAVLALRGAYLGWT